MSEIEVNGLKENIRALSDERELVVTQLALCTRTMREVATVLTEMVNAISSKSQLSLACDLYTQAEKLSRAIRKS